MLWERMSACPESPKQFRSHHLELLVQGAFGQRHPGRLFMTVEQRAIRSQKLLIRQNLSHQEQHKASALAAKFLMRHWWYQRARNLAIYTPIKKEISPLPIIQHAWRADKKLYLPYTRFKPQKRLCFKPFQPDTRMQQNRYGILEPLTQSTIHPYQLDLIICPLTAFDRAGHRIGMGSGFYDRFLKSNLNRPKLIGYAYNWQEHENIPSNSWDIPLNGIITDQGYIHIY